MRDELEQSIMFLGLRQMSHINVGQWQSINSSQYPNSVPLQSVKTIPKIKKLFKFHPLD